MIFMPKLKKISLFLVILCTLFCFFSCTKGSNDLDLSPSGESPLSTDDESQANEVELTRDEVFKKVKPSIVKVLVYDYDGSTILSQGSGFFVDDKGTFVTNAHVIKGAYYIKIQNESQKAYDVDVVLKYNDSTSDYAICRASGIDSSVPVEFISSTKAGDLVYAFGYPKDAFFISTTSGKILSTHAVLGEKQYYINTARIDHGSSGGALIDYQGRVLGITTGSSSDGEYVALKQQNFSADLAGTLDSGKSPMEQFHTSTKYQFEKSTISEYFEIYVNVVSYTDSTINYEVGARLKEQYKNAKIIADTSSLSAITVDLVTKYDYQDSFSRRVEQDSKVVHLHFSSLEEMKNGKSQLVSSASNDFDSSNCYDMQMSYEADFWNLQSGTLTIYD